MGALGISESTLERNLDQQWDDPSADWKARAALLCLGALRLDDGLVRVDDPTAPYMERLAAVIVLAGRLIDIASGNQDAVVDQEKPLGDEGLDEFEESVLTASGPQDYGGAMPSNTSAAEVVDGGSRLRRAKPHLQIARRYPGETATVQVNIITYPSQHARIADAAAARNLSQAEYVRQAIERQLDDDAVEES